VRTPPDSFISKNEGMAERHTSKLFIVGSAVKAVRPNIYSDQDQIFIVIGLSDFL
jgi:hypothetical protein